MRTPNAAEIGHFLSEWLDDYAPLNERSYVIAAEAMLRKWPELNMAHPAADEASHE